MISIDPHLLEMIESGGTEEIEAIIRLRQPGAPPPGVRLVSTFRDIATCRLRSSNVLEVRADESVASLKAPFDLGPERDVELPVDPNLPLESIPDIDERRPDGLRPTGRGVVLGFLDWGVDFAHPDFRDADDRTR